MPFPSAHHLFQIHGGMPGSEIWSIGLRASGSTVISPSTTAFMAQAVAERFMAMRNSLAAASSNPWSQDVTFTGVTGRYVNVNGVTQIQQEAVPVLAPTAAATTGFLPNQCSIVVSLITAKAGRSGKGRVYLPLLGNFIAANGRHSGATRISLAFKAFMDAVHTDWAAGTGTTAARFVVGSQVGVGALTAITQVRTGDVFDTQRRRRNALSEVYANEVLA